MSNKTLDSPVINLNRDDFTFNNLLEQLYPDLPCEVIEKSTEVEFHAVGIKIQGIDMEEEDGPVLLKQTLAHTSCIRDSLSENTKKKAKSLPKLKFRLDEITLENLYDYIREEINSDHPEIEPIACIERIQELTGASLRDSKGRFDELRGYKYSPFSRDASQQGKR